MELKTAAIFKICDEEPTRVAVEKIQYSMYYVVYLLDFGIYTAIPYTWIRNHERVLKKFMYFGIFLKKKHTHWCNDHDDAKIMQDNKLVPNIDFNADFTAAPSREFPCDGGSFECQVVDVFGKYKFDQ